MIGFLLKGIEAINQNPIDCLNFRHEKSSQTRMESCEGEMVSEAQHQSSIALDSNT